MNVIKEDGALPIRNWAADADEKTLDQARHLARLPFAVGAVALMPDAHLGYGMPIGGVLATDGVVVPNAVGVDIGCGLLYARLVIDAASLARADLERACGAVRKCVPVGFARHQEVQPMGGWCPGGPISERESVAAQRQIGSLGGGNHFLELQAGNDDAVYVMIHSGSRNIGKQVADHYNHLAVMLNERWRVAVPKAWELAFLPLDTNEGQDYMREMQACVEFARLNRVAMMRASLIEIAKALGDAEWASPVTMFDIAHNYAALEHHGGRNVVVHRKGATRARLGEQGIIPGSQGTHSYIVDGLGNPLSMLSCSHGAGRRMGRKDAERRLDLADEQRKLDEAGIVHAVRGVHDLDEAPGAYKDIDAVMAAQADLVSVTVTLRPLAVVKG